jgi:precorrin-6B methylase 2
MAKSKLKKVLNYFRNYKISRLLLAMQHQGYFIETGWIKSYKNRSPVDADDNPIPWTTYAYISFIQEYLKDHHIVFEFGAGNSTFYYAKRVKQLYSVEHNKEWFHKIAAKKPANATLHYKQLDHNYTETIQEIDTPFDVVIIDGRKRVECIEKSIDCLAENGIIVLDDSERREYYPGIELLNSKGFKRLDFWGISPGYFHNKCTSVFFKDLVL